ncbi:MAG: sigma 54-interacting transcriptional regulator [Leptospiraceae bacterium]|nr:sigma 54-interacting transcriptional regulator [Leptospiraceae bacterium]
MLHTFHNPLVALHEITLALLNEQSSEKLLDAILSQAVEFTKADSGSIALLNENRKYLEIMSAHGFGQEIKDSVKLKLGEGVTGRCILTGKTRNVGDTTSDPHYVEVRGDIRSELAVPLKVGSKSFGVISVDSSKTNAFTKEDEEYLELLASYAAQILTNQQALSSLKHRTHILEILIEMGMILGKSAVLEDLFQQFIQVLQEKVGLSRAAVYLYDEVSNELTVSGSLNFSSEEKQKSRFQPGEGITGTVFKEKRMISIRDIASDTAYLNKSGKNLEDSSVISFFAAPIILDEVVQGVFSMEIPYTSGTYFEDYTYLVQILSSLLSQAIRIRNLIESRTSEVQSENINLRRQLQKNFTFENIVGASDGMTSLFEKMRMAADSASSILLIGESGTGKELIATALHQNSIRRDSAMVKINCAAIPADLLESELFGYVKGAFTGANDDRKGKVLQAHKGTLFLDEIGEMDYRLQSKLLRILQEKEFSPLGSNKVYHVDVRIIAATNANLEKMIAEKQFREDLFYRLNVVRLDIPPLRERRADLPMLTQYLIDKIAKANQKRIKGISPQAFAKLESYDFPGNVRELENILERAIVLSYKPWLDVDDIELPGSIPRSIPEIKEPPEEKPVKTEAITQISEPGAFEFKDWLKDKIKSSAEGEIRHEVISLVEKEMISMILQNNLFNKTKTARQLGVNRLTLDRKIEEYKIIEDMNRF